MTGAILIPKDIESMNNTLKSIYSVLNLNTSFLKLSIFQRRSKMKGSICHCRSRLNQIFKKGLFRFRSLYREVIESKSSIVVQAWQPKHHILTRRCHHHGFRIKLEATYGSGMISFQNANFRSVFRVPNVYSSVR